MTPERGISKEELAAQLMQCAILVKKGENGPLLRQTIHDLTDYIATQPRTVSPNANSSTADAATVSPKKSAGNSTVTKPTKPPHLGAMLGKVVGLTGDVMHETTKSAVSKSATSNKNAARAKSDLAELNKEQPKHSSWFSGHHEETEWCDEHFTMGCACKARRIQPEAPNTITTTTTTSTTTTSHKTHPQPRAPVANTAAAPRPRVASSTKPAFQRPTNPKASLLANGWIEQQRRSKMRTVWKEVMASLVEGRKPGEETTLWIQREITNPLTNKRELEALHQIPVKWLEEVHYMDYSADNRFSLKVYNLCDEFVFRCASDEEAAQNWVLTLRSIQQIVRKKPTPTPALNDAIDKGANRSFEEEKKLPEVQQVQQQPDPGHRMSVKELQAVAHGAGINTHGMERGELEKVVAQIAGQGSGGAQSVPAPAAGKTAAEEQRGRRDQQEELERRRRLEEVRRQQLEEEAAKRRAEAELERKRREAAKLRAEEEACKRKEAEAEQQRRVAERVKEQRAAERKKREEEERRRLAEERQRRDEEEVQRRLAEKQAAEQRRKLEEAQRLQQEQWQKQQQAWQQQQAEEEQRRRQAEQRAAEERRRQEEAYRRQQQQQQQQQQQRWQQPPPHPQQHPQQQHPQWQAGQRPQPSPPYAQSRPVPPPSAHFNGTMPNQPPPPPHQQQQSSPINIKYAKMAQQTNDDGQIAISTIKHGLLVEWALQPPMLQVLRPIEELITTIHTVFPPKFGVPAHDHFSKWTAISYSEISQGPALGNRPDDAKLKKVVRKLRFFLHPDKLPRDLSTEQAFMCKMLWDVISDAEAEHKKKEEELGWIRG